MAIEYALALEKPVLFVDLPRRVRNPDWQELEIEPLEASFRKLAGDIVSPRNLAEAVEKISHLLETCEEFQQTMQALRPQMIFNMGNSIELGAREIARLADEKAAERLAREQQGV
jgi:YidC/Oxa1 family membrane protein insertase